ncbi:MAG: ABC transporter substrate-binding protein [Spirochaetota bacterium]
MMIGKRIRATVLTLAFVVGAALPLSAQDTVSMAIGYIPNIQFAPLYVGMEKGFFAEEDLELDVEYGFGVDVFSLLSLGRIDVGLSDSDQLIIGGTQDLGLKAIFQYYQDYPVSIVALEDGYDSPEDLQGATIGVPETSGTSYIGMKAFLREYGLEDSVDEQRIGYTQVSSLLNEQVDAAVTFYNNEPVKLRLEGEDIVEWEVREFSDIVGASIISSDRILEERRDVLERFVRAMQKSMAYTVENQEEAVELSLPYLGDVEEDDEEFISRSLAATAELFTPESSDRAYGSFDVPRYQTSIDTMEELGLIDETYEPSRILENLGQ